MSKHTPGPWRRDTQYGPEAGAETYSPYIVDGTGQNVAAAMMMPHSEGEFVANARLIAAAPELLAELIRALNKLDALQSAPGVNSPPVSDMDAYQSARALIARIKG